MFFPSQIHWVSWFCMDKLYSEHNSGSCTDRMKKSVPIFAKRWHCLTGFPNFHSLTAKLWCLIVTEITQRNEKYVLFWFEFPGKCWSEIISLYHHYSPAIQTATVAIQTLPFLKGSLRVVCLRCLLLLAWILLKELNWDLVWEINCLRSLRTIGGWEDDRTVLTMGTVKWD